jgi:predicted benzoate:H+ symporter BenE
MPVGSEGLRPRLVGEMQCRPRSVWLVAVVVACSVVYVGLAIPFDAYLDRCDAFHESPNTPLGWGIAALVVAALGTIAVALRRRVPVAAVIVGLVWTVAWCWWLLTPKGSC